MFAFILVHHANDDSEESAQLRHARLHSNLRKILFRVYIPAAESPSYVVGNRQAYSHGRAIEFKSTAAFHASLQCTTRKALLIFPEQMPQCNLTQCNLSRRQLFATYTRALESLESKASALPDNHYFDMLNLNSTMSPDGVAIMPPAVQIHVYAQHCGHVAPQQRDMTTNRHRSGLGGSLNITAAFHASLQCATRRALFIFGGVGEAREESRRDGQAHGVPRASSPER